MVARGREDGKPPGWFQLLVFAVSQVFIGLVMQPAALWYQSAFEPFIAKTPLHERARAREASWGRRAS